MFCVGLFVAHIYQDVQNFFVLALCIFHMSLLATPINIGAELVREDKTRLYEYVYLLDFLKRKSTNDN